jgi:hypothetical protein
MRYHNHEVVLFHVLHHDELTFSFDRMTKFVGLEIDAQFVAHPEDLRRDYLRAFGEFRRNLEAMAHRNQCECVLVDTGRGLAETLGDYLNQRSRIGRRM